MTYRRTRDRSPQTSALGRASLALLLALAIVVAATLVAPSLAAASEEGPAGLTATVTPAAITYPGSAVISGEGAPPGATLLLFARPAGQPDWPTGPVSSATATTAGAYRFSKVKPSVTTEYRVEVRDGDPPAQAEVRLRVRPRVTASFPAGLWLGGSVRLSGRVEPAHPGGSVTIERRVAGVWEPLVTGVTLDGASRFAHPWKPEEFGFYRLRARMEADDDHDAGASASRQVVVNRPNAHRVPMRFAHYIVIVRHEYRLYYYERGVMVRRFEVALGRPGYATPLGRYRIYGKRKPGGGALGACVMFYRRRGGIAIHGTNEPWLIRRPAPRRYSHGCARMLNSQALWLYARVPVGTRVHNLR